MTTVLRVSALGFGGVVTGKRVTGRTGPTAETVVHYPAGGLGAVGVEAVGDGLGVVEGVADGAGQPRRRLEGDGDGRQPGMGGHVAEVEDVEPRRRDAGQHEILDVFAVEPVDHFSDRGGRVAPSDSTRRKNDAIDDAARTDDRASEIALSVPSRFSDTERAGAAFHAFAFSSSLISLSRSSSSSFDAVNSYSTSP